MGGLVSLDDESDEQEKDGHTLEDVEAEVAKVKMELEALRATAPPAVVLALQPQMPQTSQRSPKVRGLGRTPRARSVPAIDVLRASRSKADLSGKPMLQSFQEDMEYSGTPMSSAPPSTPYNRPFPQRQRSRPARRPGRGVGSGLAEAASSFDPSTASTALVPVRNIDPIISPRRRRASLPPTKSPSTVPSNDVVSWALGLWPMFASSGKPIAVGRRHSPVDKIKKASVEERADEMTIVDVEEREFKELEEEKEEGKEEHEHKQEQEHEQKEDEDAAPNPVTEEQATQQFEEQTAEEEEVCQQLIFLEDRLAYIESQARSMRIFERWIFLSVGMLQVAVHMEISCARDTQGSCSSMHFSSWETSPRGSPQRVPRMRPGDHPPKLELLPSPRRREFLKLLEIDTAQTCGSDITTTDTVVAAQDGLHNLADGIVSTKRGLAASDELVTHSKDQSVTHSKNGNEIKKSEYWLDNLWKQMTTSNRSRNMFDWSGSTCGIGRDRRDAA
eukprot:TRINITY_DN43806_c0_g1_i1.p1 TRINITY_DN43806_c0_g1~~TRINITY_DN43806_c0_g1_i1.p1  ORF type:complete len:528 (-),score=106.90 TRINITY_DN43806_c0_g1_i1:67-1575(-)